MTGSATIGNSNRERVYAEPVGIGPNAAYAGTIGSLSLPSSSGPCPPIRRANPPSRRTSAMSRTAGVSESIAAVRSLARSVLTVT